MRQFYTPSSDEVQQRIKVMRTMIHNHWPKQVIGSVFDDENPDPDLVFRLMSKFGHEVARAVLMEFLDIETTCN